MASGTILQPQPVEILNVDSIRMFTTTSHDIMGIRATYNGDSFFQILFHGPLKKIEVTQQVSGGSEQVVFTVQGS